jgi:diguanylate cyclase (GGDEF)-like protein/PAS domain S-box-containing protein
MGSQPKTLIDVLLIEDNMADARLVELLLGEIAPNQFRFALAASLADALTKAALQDFHVALLDLSLPDSQGLETLARLHAQAPTLPIVVFTGTDDDQLAIKALQNGAEDYLVKGQGSAELVRRAIRYAIERANADATLKRSEGQFRAVFENAGLGIGLIDDRGHLFSANPALRAMLADDPTECPEATLYDYIHPDDRCAFVEMTDALLGGAREDLSLEVRFVPKAGFFAWGRVNVSLVRGADQRPQFAVGMVEDITGRKVMEDQLRLAAKVLEATSEGVFVTDAGLNIIHVNPSFSRLTGFDAADVLGNKPSVLSSGRHGPEFYANMWKSIGEEGFWRGEIWDRKKSGELFAIWLNISMVRNEHGETSHYFAVFSDITLRKLSEERLSHLANHDTLTGLPNRALFQERLGRALIRAERNKLVFALLFLDLDQFKQINDNLGHLIGDVLLREVGDRLSSTVRRQDTVARLGGDEFVLIIEDINDFRDAATVAQKILGQFTEPFLLNGQPTKISASVGISLYPGDGSAAETLLHQADEAMYCAKKQGRASFRFASTDLSERAFEREALRRALLRAVEEGGLEIHYQPIVDLTTNAIISVEALLRWRHPEIGLMVPGQFLPVAIDSGLMPAIGRWVLKSSVRQVARWRRDEHPDLRLCVNVSQKELHAKDFIHLMHDTLAEGGIPAGAVDVEIPESLAMDDVPATLRAIAQLHDLKCRVTLDDFGAGRTDFRALRQVPIDTLKIAPEFIRGLPGSGDEAKLVNAAIVVAHSLPITVIAKAVETSEQYTFLRQHHCDAAQGYLFSRPVPPDEFPPRLDFTALVER